MSTVARQQGTVGGERLVVSEVRSVDDAARSRHHQRGVCQYQRTITFEVAVCPSREMRTK